jgi:hypothetical protein
MSGGHFCSNEYVYYKVDQFADELENNIENNSKVDEYNYAPNYSEEVISLLKSKIPEIRRVAKIMKAIDYLYSGDHGEDSFLEKIKEIEEKDYL